MNRIIRVSVEDYMLNNLWESAGASESGNAVTLRLSFSEHWNNTAKTAIFTDALGETSVAVPVLPGSDTLVIEEEDGAEAIDISVPAEAMRYPGTASVTIVGVEVDGEIVKKRITTRAGRLRIMESGVPEKIANAAPMTATDKEQIIAAYDGMRSGVQQQMENFKYAEQARVTAEADRETAEGVREANETTRQENEAYRQDVEQGYIAQAAREADRAEAEADRASIPAVAGVYNVIVRDKNSGEKFALIVESGVLKLLGVSPELDAADVSLIDTGTGVSYVLIAENGTLKLQEV